MKLDAGVVSKNSSSYIIDDLSLIEELSEEEQEIRGGYLTTDYEQVFEGPDGTVLGNVIYSGEGLPWQTGGNDLASGFQSGG